MAERGDGRLARRQAMLREQFGNGAIRRPPLPQFRDDIARREQVLNFCGRSGVNSATAWRTVAGSNEVISRNGLDANLEIGRRQDGHRDATTSIIFCQSRFADSPRACRVRGRGQFTAAECLRTI